MTRTLTAALTTEVTRDVTSPGYLIEIQFSTPLRLSTRGTMVWSGNTWTTWGAIVRGIATDSQGDESSASIMLWNGDYTLSALVLGEGIANRVVNIWKFYGDSALTVTDPVHVFSGVADDASVNPTNGEVTINLVRVNAAAQFAPRFYITPDNGFSFLPAPGTVIDWDGERFILDPEQ